MEKGKGPLAVAIIVDSSHNVLAQWPDILRLYVSRLLSRLVNSDGGPRNTLLGLIIYANAEHRPTPILAKRYFIHPKALIPEMQEDPRRLCLGTIHSSPTTRLAALEGYAAALDMFEVLSSSQDADRIHSSEKSGLQESNHDSHHIIHIAYCPPDNSPNPLWNQVTELDTLSWKTMPEELAKRNICLNMILLNRIPQFAELHSATCSSPSQPWFEVRSDHQILLSALPAPPAETAPVPKPTISGATQSNLSAPDAKKQRTTQDNPAPLNVQPTNSAVTSATNAETNGPPQSTSAHVPNPNMALMIQLIQRNQDLEGQMKMKFAQMQAAQQSGRTDDAEKIKAELTPLYASFRKIRDYLNQFRTLAAQHAQNAQPADSGAKPENQNPPSLQVQPEKTPAPTMEPIAQTQPQPPTSSGSEPLRKMQLPQAVQQKLMQQIHTQNPALAQRLQSVPPEELEAQLLKLVQQRVLASQANAANQVAVSSSQPRAPAPQMHSTERWQGTLTWSGYDAVHQVRKEVTAQVVATKYKDKSIRADLWPHTLRLFPAPQRHILPKVLTDWIKRHDPAMSRISALSVDTDVAQNESNFKSLITLLQDRGMIAVCSWKQSPDRPNVVIVPVDSTFLVAAVFPEGGAPDLPTNPQQLLPSPDIQPNPSRPVNVYPNIPPNDQTHALLLARAQHAGITMNPAAFAGGSSGAPFRMGIPMGIGQPPQQITQMSGLGMGGMANGQMNQGGNPANMNLDMVHSFMQRNFGTR